MLVGAFVSTPHDARADSIAGYSCSDLWRARNDIYFNKGHCFKTKRGQRAYPGSCFHPYGKLNSFERREVSRIRQAERRRGC